MIVPQLLIIFAGFCGFLISFYIRHKKKASEKLVCYLGSNCEAVVHSQFAFFFGIPVEVIGMFYYGVLALGYGLRAALPVLVPSWFHLALLTLSAAAFLFSAYLIFIQAFTIKQWCMWCIFSAGLCTAIFLTGITAVAGTMIPLLMESRSFILLVHGFAVAIGVGAATITDIFFFKFLKNFKITEDEADILHTLSQVIWTALGLIVLTGIGLFLPKAAVLLMMPKFLVKLIVVVVILANGSVLNLYVSPQLIQISFGEAHHHVPGELHHIRKIAFALGAVSLTSWYSAFILGSLRSISFSGAMLLTLYGVALLVAIGMSQLMERLFSKRAFEE